MNYTCTSPQGMYILHYIWILSFCPCSILPIPSCLTVREMPDFNMGCEMSKANVLCGVTITFALMCPQGGILTRNLGTHRKRLYLVTFALDLLKYIICLIFFSLKRGSSASEKSTQCTEITLYLILISQRS